MNLTVKQLRKDLNFKVRVTHSRFIGEGKNEQLLPIKVIRDGGLQKLINPFGGLTLIEADKDGKNYKVEARCSRRDQFNRKLALNIALGRLAKSLL